MIVRPAAFMLVLLLSLAALVPGVGAAEPLPRSSPASQTPTAALPPHLQALEAKMQQLHVNSERYTRISKGAITVVNETNGKPVGPKKLVSLDEDMSAEVSISPARAEEIDIGTRKPIRIEVGSTEYTYSREIARKHPHRAWVRRNGADIVTSFPYHASPNEATAGGEGSYAQLFNLLSTVTGPVAVHGPVSVDGQPTTEFTAEIEPLRLIRGLTAEDLQNLRKHPVSTTLNLFLSEAGFPLRVTVSQSARGLQSVETTEITGVDVPISVAAPPARSTLSVAQARRLEGRGHIVATSR